MKCEVCKQNIKEAFLKKLMGAYIRDTKGKRHAVCSKCQKLGKEEIKGKISL